MSKTCRVYPWYCERITFITHVNKLYGKRFKCIHFYYAKTMRQLILRPVQVFIKVEKFGTFEQNVTFYSTLVCFWHITLARLQ